MVITSTAVSNPQNANPGILPGVDLWQRLEEVRVSQDWTGREFARRAGLRNDSHYGVLTQRLRAGQTIQSDTLTSLARAAASVGYSTEWLLYGTGEKMVGGANQKPVVQPQRRNTPTPTPVSVVRYSQTAPHGTRVVTPNRDRAAQLLAARGLEPHEIEECFSLAALDARIAPGEDPPTHWWIDCMRAAIAAASPRTVEKSPKKL